MSALEKIQADDLALAVANAMAIANEAALHAGTDPHSSLITISQEHLPAGRIWRIHYGPRDYINCRGGDVTVLVDERAGEVKRIQRGQ